VPKKERQDRLDAALCLLIVIRWRLGDRGQSVAVGDLKSDYIIALSADDAAARKLWLRRIKAMALRRLVAQW
jgi:predicted RNase H-like nuclease